LEIKSPFARLDALLCSMEEITCKHNLQEVFQSDGGKRNWVKFMINALRPFRLRQQMKIDVDVTMPQLQNDPKLFFEELTKKIIMFEIDVPAERQKNSNKKRSRDNHPVVPGNKRPKSTTPPACFKCKQTGHRMAECPLKPSKTEQKELFKQQRVLKKPNKSGKKFNYTVVARISQTADVDGSSKYDASVEVTLADGKLECAGILDSGADLTIIPESMINKMLGLGSEISTEILAEPITAVLANNDTANMSKKVLLDITLQTKAGELMIPEQPCLVWNTSRNEIFWGTIC
jgi:hypothetical protein